MPGFDRCCVWEKFFCWFFKTINFINFTLCALGTEQIRQLHWQALIKSTKQLCENKTFNDGENQSRKIQNMFISSWLPRPAPCELSLLLCFLVRGREKQALPGSCQAVEELLDYSILFSLSRQWNCFFASMNICFITKPAVQIAQLFDLGWKLYPSNMQCMLNKDIT